MRQFIVSQMPDAFGFVEITGKNYRYLSSVLRLNVGDFVDVRLPSNELCFMRIAQKENNKILLQIDKNQNNESKEINGSSSGFDGGVGAQDLSKMNLNAVAENGEILGYGARLWLLQFMPKAAKLDSIIRQATEIGVEKIYPVIGERSLYEKKDDGKAKLDRWNRIIKEARQQSASPINTKIDSPLFLEDVIEKINEQVADKKVCRLVLTEFSYENLSIHKYFSEKPDIVIVVVGSEGGISSSELALLKNNEFMPVHFCTNVLRAETAAIYGISCVQTILTEYSSWKLKE